MDKEKQFTNDIRRTIILGKYMHYWGIPEYRVIGQKEDNIVEIYSFPPQHEQKIHRFATVGISSIKRENGEKADWEFLMVLPANLASNHFDLITSFILDVFVYSLKNNVQIGSGLTSPETTLMPNIWLPKAILMDEPRGEPEDLCTFQIGSQNVELLWLIPIYKSEYDLIFEKGLDEFDKLVDKMDNNLADPTRPALL